MERGNNLGKRKKKRGRERGKKKNICKGSHFVVFVVRVISW